jgi:outer membrane protein assembly factor BamB
VIDGLLMAEYRLNGVHTFNALAAKDGKIRWKTAGSCRTNCNAAAMVSDGRLYLFEDEFDPKDKFNPKILTETLTALDLHSGKKLYQRSIPSLYLYHSDVHHGIVYFMISKVANPNQKDWKASNSIYAIQLLDGIKLWQHEFDKLGEAENTNDPCVAP